MKLSKTFKIEESTLQEIKSLSASQNLAQGEVIDNGVKLLKIKFDLQKKSPCKVLKQSESLPRDKLNKVKEGGSIILELKFEQMTFSMFSLLTVESFDGLFGKARFIKVMEGEKRKTFEKFDTFKDLIVDFSADDICDFTDDKV